MTSLALLGGLLWILASTGVLGGGVLYGLAFLGWPDELRWRVPAGLGLLAVAGAGAFSLGCASAFMSGPA